MAGSYHHIVDDSGALIEGVDFVDMIEHLGDAYQMAEEMYGMIWWLADGDRSLVETACLNYKAGLARAPQVGG